MRQNLSKSLTWAVILSETGHLFCCVFPTVFSILSLLAGFGMVAALPPSMVAFHDMMHHWEVPIIAVSGVILVLGWIADHYSRKMDCHDTGCGHGACAPRKNRAHIVLKIATALFLFNVIVYVTVHRTDFLTSAVEEAHDHTSDPHEAH